jgi:alpha-ketoglutarate-dependent taurine dioxygenase
MHVTEFPEDALPESLTAPRGLLGNYIAALEALRRDGHLAKADLTAVLKMGAALSAASLHSEACACYFTVLDEKPDEREVLRALATAQESCVDRIISKSVLQDHHYRPIPYSVTALVSTYASEGFIGECLSDLVEQTIAPEVEIIVVDSASPQREGDVVLEFQRKHTNIRYLRTPRRIGIYAAWNVALRLASGALIAPFSTNDRLSPVAYETLRQALCNHPDVALVYGDTYLTDSPHQRFGDHTPSVQYGGAFRWPPHDFEHLLDHCPVGPHPMWRRSLHQEVGYFDQRYTALGDQDFWNRLAWRHELLHIPVFTGLAWLTKDALSCRPIARTEVEEIKAKHRRYYQRQVRLRRGSSCAPMPERTSAAPDTIGRARVTLGSLPSTAQAKDAFQAHGVLVNAENGRGIMDLATERLREEFRTKGLLLLRGFHLDVPAFKQLTERLSHEFVSYAGGASVRSPIEGDPTVLSVSEAKAAFYVPLHGEMYYVERKPEILWFYCKKPANRDGETTLGDATWIYNRLQPRTRRLFDSSRIKYIMIHPKDRWQTVFQTSNLEQVAAYCRDAAWSMRQDDRDGSIITEHLSSAVWTAKHSGERTFINNLYSTMYWERQGFPYRKVRMDDESVVPDSVFQELAELERQATFPVKWQQGDVLMVDNTRFMHGRRAFSDPSREIYVRIAMRE